MGFSAKHYQSPEGKHVRTGLNTVWQTNTVNDVLKFTGGAGHACISVMGMFMCNIGYFYTTGWMDDGFSLNV